MKKILTLCLVAGLSACATSELENCENTAPLAPQQPVYSQPQYVQRQAPTGYTYTVSEPVEVVYKNTTYRTVYEPKTYSSTAYVKKPYSCTQGDICKNAPVAGQPVGVQE